MKKTIIFTVLFLFGFSCSISISAEINYKVISVKDMSYSDVRRETIRVSVLGDVIPTELQFKEIANKVKSESGGFMKNTRLFIYVKGMPTNSSAYAIATFKFKTMDTFTINKWTLEMHELSKKKK